MTLPSQQKENLEKIEELVYIHRPSDLSLTQEQVLAFDQHENKTAILLNEVNTLTASTWEAAQDALRMEFGMSGYYDCSEAVKAERERVRALVHSLVKYVAGNEPSNGEGDWNAALGKLLTALDSESSGTGV